MGRHGYVDGTSRGRGIRVGEVTVRLAEAYERSKWDELMRVHHDLGFKRFVGRGSSCG